MAGTSCMNDGDHGRLLPASLLVATVADLLTMYIQKGHPSESAEFSDLCLSLARGIDYAVANNEIPLRARDLPFLLKQVLRRMSDSSLQAVAMVLMIAVKNACKIGWFLDHDATNLLTLAKEIGKNFSTMEDINVESDYSLLNVPKIMLRYYPRLKIDHILASLQVKPGYGAFVVDFYITRSMVSPAQKQICLFVAQTDDIDTSSCIVTPPQVNFLLNGKGVRGRINVSMDNGPQLPTNVTAMLKYGINLLQVVGQFDGNYVIIISFMSVVSTSDIPDLPDYVQLVTVTCGSVSDLEIIEGQARISLNCPISFRRINIPVKGHLCKHHQCFDYGNFMEINSRRPSWRCPHCNQSVSNLDIRIDQKMAQILREVGESVVDVIISPDGSWKPAMESIDNAEQMYDATQNNQQENDKQCDYITFSSNPADAVDLTTGGNNDDEFPSNFGIEDMKPFWEDLQEFAAPEKNVSPGVSNTVEGVQDIPAHREDNFRTGGVLTPSSSEIFALPTTLNTHSNIGISQNTSATSSSPVLTDAVSPSPFRETLDVHRETTAPIPSLQNQHFNPGDLQSQQSILGSFMSNEYGGLASRPRHITRNPIAVQALPAQDNSSRLGQPTRLTPTGAIATDSQTTSFIAPSVEGFDAVNGVAERDHQFSRPLMSSLLMSGQSIQHVGGLPNPRTTQPMTEPWNIVRPFIHVRPVLLQPRRGGNQVPSPASNRQSPRAAAGQQPVQMLRSPPSVPVQLRPTRTGTGFSVGAVAEQLRTAGEQRRNPTSTPWSTPRPDASASAPMEENWRPSGRMRGSLTGEAYSAALNQFFLQVQPTQQTPTRPPQLPASLPSNLPGGLPTFRLFPGDGAPSPGDVQPRLRPKGGGSSGTLPEWTPRMP